VKWPPARVAILR